MPPRRRALAALRSLEVPAPVLPDMEIAEGLPPEPIAVSITVPIARP